MSDQRISDYVTNHALYLLKSNQCKDHTDILIYTHKKQIDEIAKLKTVILDEAEFLDTLYNRYGITNSDDGLYERAEELHETAK